MRTAASTFHTRPDPIDPDIARSTKPFRDAELAEGLAALSPLPGA